MIDGATFDPSLDACRLNNQLGKVFEVMRCGKWKTLQEVREETGEHFDSAISARIRDLRKPKFGGYRVEARRRPGASLGLWEYRLAVKRTPQQLDLLNT